MSFPASTNPETSIQIEKLAAILRDLGPGDTASYGTLSEAVGYPIQQRPFPLMKARLAVEDEQGLRFETVATVGVRKLHAEAVPGIGKSVRKRVGRAARRAAKRLTGLRYNGIDARLQARIDAERSLLAAISTVSTADVQEIEKQTSSTGPMVARQVFDTLRKKEKTNGE
jgi:hypothetical protein